MVESYTLIGLAGSMITILAAIISVAKWVLDMRKKLAVLEGTSNEILQKIETLNLHQGAGFGGGGGGAFGGGGGGGIGGPGGDGNYFEHQER